MFDRLRNFFYRDEIIQEPCSYCKSTLVNVLGSRFCEECWKKFLAIKSEPVQYSNILEVAQLATNPNSALVTWLRK